MKTNFLTFKSLLVILLLLNSCRPAKDKWEWVNVGGSDTYDGTRDIIMDNSGNIYVIGRFQGTIVFGETRLEGMGDDGVFLVKYDTSGKLIWARQAGGKKEDVGYGISIDVNDNIYITGYFNDTANFDKIQLISKGKEDIFIAKYDQNGNAIWAKQAGGEYKDEAHSIVTDRSGSSYITGYFSGKIKFDTLEISGPDFIEDIFIAKYDKDGNVIWVKKAGGSSNDRSTGISMDEHENIFLSGYFTKTAYFDSITVNTSNQADIFVAKYNKDGKALWVKQAGGPSWDEASCVDVDKQGNVLVAGFFVNEAMFDSTVLTSFGDRDIFISKYDSNGKFLWVKQAGGEKIDECKAIDVTPEGDFYITGFFGEKVKFDTTTVTSSGDYDIFFSHYSSDGNLLFAQQAGGKGCDEGRAVLYDGKENLYLAGGFNGKAKFGNSETKEAQDFDMFVAKYNLKR